MKHTDPNNRPTTNPPQFVNIPGMLRKLKQWVLWRYDWREDQSSWSKVPYQINGQHASTTNSETWSDFANIMAGWNQHQARYDGIGFVFTRESKIVGIDIDNCVEWQTEDGAEFCTYNEVVKRVMSVVGDTYAEFSPSRTGVHFYVLANPSQAVKDSTLDLEVYAESRYFTFTGDIFNAADIIDAQEGVEKIVASIIKQRAERPKPEHTGEVAQATGSHLSIEDRLQIAFNSANGEAIKRLFDGDLSPYRTADNEGRSEGDMALARYLAGYCDGNALILSLMMQQSKLKRDKWNERHYADGSSYLQKTIDQVLSTQTFHFKPGTNLFTQQQKSTPTEKAERASRRFRLDQLEDSAIKFRRNPAMRGLEVGWDNLDYLYTPRKGSLTTWVGEPGAGKSTFVMNYVYHFAMVHGMRAGLCSFEARPIDALVLAMVQCHIKKPTFPDMDGCCSDEDLRVGLREIGPYFTAFTPTFDEANMDALCQFFDDEITENGMDIAYIDPFTELQPPDKLADKYTNFVSKELSKLVQYTGSRSLITHLVCHPTKNWNRKDGLRLWNINGSGDFERKTDYGIVITREDGRAVLDVQKVRAWFPGQNGKAAFKYDIRAARYTQSSVPMTMGPNSGKGRKVNHTPF